MRSEYWSKENEEDLAKAWIAEGSLKAHLPKFPGRTYQALIKHAHKMGLGPRPHSDRGVPPYAMQAMMAELKKAPGTRTEIAERANLTVTAVCQQIKKTKPGPRGKTHIIGWRRRSTGYLPTPVYASGPGENVPMPAPLTNTAKSRINRARSRIRALNEQIPGKKVNPFATAAGLVVAPAAGNGRVYQQSMSIKDDEMEAA